MTVYTETYNFFPKPIGPDVVASRPAATEMLQLVIYMATDAPWAICIDAAWIDFPSTGGGGITEITSTDLSVTITDPTGPTVDLSVPPPVVSFTDLREQFSGTVSIDPAGTNPDWTHTGGSTLVDLTNPAQPTIIDAGLYCVSGLFALDSTFPGEFGTIALVLDAAAGITMNGADTFPLDGDPSQNTLVGPVVTAYVPAGGAISAFLTHGDLLPIDIEWVPTIQQILAG